MDRVNLERSIAIYVAAPTYAAYTSLCLVYEPAQPHPQLPNPKDMRSAKALTCVDLFAGCGGLSLGLERAGFDTVLFSELNADAAATFRANRASRDLLEFGDVTQLLKKGVIDGVKHKLRERAEPVKRIDLLCGGPPCQGYSGIGHRRTHAVERQEIPSNHLYLDMIEAIRAFSPRMFLFENVRGLLTGRWTAEGAPGEIWTTVRTAFENVGDYAVSHAVVQAKDYGVPQNRPRVLLVGIHKDLGWIPETGSGVVADGLLPRARVGSAPDLVDVLDDLVDTRFPDIRKTETYRREAKSEFQTEMRRIGPRVLDRGEPLTEQEYSKHSDKITEKFQYMIDHGGEILPEMKTKKFAQRLLPKRWGPTGPTITATSLPDDFVHYEQPRAPTVREWARLQCFPDWYQFRGKRTTGGVRRAGNPSEGNWDREVPKYTQIGNAVPVRLAHSVGVHLGAILRQA